MSSAWRTSDTIADYICYQPKSHLSQDLELKPRLLPFCLVRTECQCAFYFRFYNLSPLKKYCCMLAAWQGILDHFKSHLSNCMFCQLKGLVFQGMQFLFQGGLHLSKIMLKIILNRLKPQAEKTITEERAGFRAGRSTTEQIFSPQIICEKYLQHQQDIYHAVIDFKKAFNRVWHTALWATMKKYNISANLIQVIRKLGH